MNENLAQFLGDVSPIGPGRAAQDDCGGSELSFRPDARGVGADASSRPPLGQRVESNAFTFGGPSAATAATTKSAADPSAASDDKPRFSFSFGATTAAAATGGGAAANNAAANAAVTKPRRTLAPSASARYGASGGLSGAYDDGAAAADAVPPAGGSLLRYSTAGGLPPATLRPSGTGTAATANTATTGGGGVSGLTFGGASKASTLGGTSYTQQQQHRSTTSSYGSTAAAAAQQQQQQHAQKPLSANTTTTTTNTGLQSLQQRAAAVGVTQTTTSTAYGQRSSLFSRPSAAAAPATPPDAVAAAPAAAAGRAAANNPAISPAPSSPRTATPRPLLPTGTYLDVLTWRDSGRSSAHLCAGLAALGAAALAAYYPHGVSALTAVACLGMLDLAINFVRFFTPFSDRARLRWAGSSALGELAAAAAALVRSLGGAHDRWLSASDPGATLRAAVALWLAAWVGTLDLPPLALAAASWVALFTLPWAWLTQGRRARSARRAALRLPVVGPLIACAEMAASCAGSMPRTTRLVGTVAGITALALGTRSWVQVGAGLFVALCHWRTALAPGDIESIRSAAEPWTQSVRKVGKRLTSAMEDAWGGAGAGAGAGGASTTYGAVGAGRVGGGGVGAGVGNGASLAARVAAGRSYY